MQSDQSYRLVVRSGTDTLLLTIEGAITEGAGKHLRQLQDVAQRLGIPVRVDVRQHGTEALPGRTPLFG